MKNILTICVLVFTSTLTAQTVTTAYQFQDGIYRSLSDFQEDKPALSWRELDAEVHINDNDYEAKFTNMKTKSGEELDRGTLWGVSIKGVPYIRVNEYLGEARLSTNDVDPQLFVRLQAIGPLCYFYFEGFVKEKVPITVYDPVTSIPIRTTEIEKDRQVVIKKLLDFNTGKIYDYNLENFLSLIKEKDLGLHKTLVGLDAEAAREKLYKSVFIYNDRHPVEIHRK